MERYFETIVRGKQIKLVFFDNARLEEYNPELLDLVVNSKIIEKDNFIKKWFLIDDFGNEYSLLKNALIINSLEDKAIFSHERRQMLTIIFSKFLENNDLPPDTTFENEKLIELLDSLTISNRLVNKKIVIWDVTKILNCEYSGALIVNNEVVGKVECDILDKDEILESYREGDIPYKNMSLYISRVDINSNFQNKGLCKPLLSFTIRNLKSLGYEMIFIENASYTKEGIPACLCYFKSGVDSGYKMRYLENSSIKKMKVTDCFKKPKPTTYYYMSENIYNRGINKIKTKLISKIREKKKKSKKKNNNLSTF